MSYYGNKFEMEAFEMERKIREDWQRMEIQSMKLLAISSISSRSLNTLRKTAIALSVLSCVAVTACPPSMSTECRDFFLQPASERERLFRTYELNKQLELYRCGMNRRPPDSSLPLVIAERGRGIIPTLLDKLEAEQDELLQYGIIEIFEVMSVKGYLRNRRDVVDRIRQVASKMKISTFREMAEKDLSRIEQNSAALTWPARGDDNHSPEIQSTALHRQSQCGEKRCIRASHSISKQASRTCGESLLVRNQFPAMH